MSFHFDNKNATLREKTQKNDKFISVIFMASPMNLSFVPRLCQGYSRKED